MTAETFPEDDWSGELAITGVGLVTPVGLYADATLTALRAGISRLSRLSQLNILVDESEMDLGIGAEVPWMQKRRLDSDRSFLLMKPALEEVFASARLSKSDRIGAYLGTSGSNPAGRLLNYDKQHKKNFLDLVPNGFNITHARLVPAGRVSVLKAIRLAAAAFNEGIIDVAVIGASDSWINPRSLTWLREKGRLSEFPRRTGTFPAEAAGFLILENPERAQQRQADIYSLIKSSAGRFDETALGEANNGLPLTHCIRSVTTRIDDKEALVISDLCGERYRVMEWVMALPKAMWDYQNLHHWNPADRVGDSGTAMGAISLAWAADAIRKGYAPSRNSLIWGASDEGHREAAVVSAYEGF